MRSSPTRRDQRPERPDGSGQQPDRLTAAIGMAAGHQVSKAPPQPVLEQRLQRMSKRYPRVIDPRIMMKKSEEGSTG